MLAPGSWPGWAWMEEPCHVLPRHLEANTLAHVTEGSALGPSLPAATLAGASGSLEPSLESSPPYCDSPWAKGAAGGVI